jgi:hypothetical protein
MCHLRCISVSKAGRSLRQTQARSRQHSTERRAKKRRIIDGLHSSAHSPCSVRPSETSTLHSSENQARVLQKTCCTRAKIQIVGRGKCVIGKFLDDFDDQSRLSTERLGMLIMAMISVPVLAPLNSGPYYSVHLAVCGDRRLHLRSTNPVALEWLTYIASSLEFGTRIVTGGLSVPTLLASQEYTIDRIGVLCSWIDSPPRENRMLPSAHPVLPNFCLAARMPKGASVNISKT